MKMKMKIITTILLIATVIFSAAPSAHALTFGTFLQKLRTVDVQLSKSGITISFVKYF